jgi:hypothetical protein
LKKLIGALLLCLACGPSQIDERNPSDEQIIEEDSAITSVDHSKVERQSIGNCWVYAVTGWAEALNRSAAVAGQEELNLSQSYITYWHWFDQIANSGVSNIETGGSYEVALRLFDRYGMTREGHFIPSEATAEMSARQKSALDKVNASLKSGVLADSKNRRNRAMVRAELDKAWNLDADVVKALDTVFGKDVSKTIARDYTMVAPAVTTRADGSSVVIIRAKDIAVKTTKFAAGVSTASVGTLQDVMGSGNYSRTGALAWKSVYYPTNSSSRRAFQKRVQRALHDKQPVIVSWFVDFNALGRDSTFKLDRLQQSGPGRQGGHMVVMHDYEVDNVPGFGTLPAGTIENRPEALTAALSDTATIKFFRIKNSWGTMRSDRWDTSSLPGYHDLYVDYLNGPVKQCTEKADGSVDTASCSNTTPLWDVVLPAGY